MQTVDVKPEMIRWAIDRSGLPEEMLLEKFPKLDEWQTGQKQPTLRQLEKFAKKTMTPFGVMFLDEPPEEELPVPDFRTMKDASIRRPSPNLIETIQSIQQRQDWIRDWLIEEGSQPMQGQRVLTCFSRQDLQQELVVPGAAPAFHRDARFLRVLLEK